MKDEGREMLSAMPDHMYGMIAIVGAPLVGALNNDNGMFRMMT